MRKSTKIILVILLIIIAILIIIINILLNKNAKLLKIEKSKEQLVTGDGLILTSSHLTSVAEINTKLTDFKSKIATAITNKGIETNADDTAETMASNIENIKTGSDSFSIILGASNGWDESGSGSFSMDVSEYSSFEITNIVNAGYMNATGNSISVDGENYGKPYTGMKIDLNGKSKIDIILFLYSTSTYRTFNVYATFYK